jgi:type IV pilus assembly protein PilV
MKRRTYMPPRQKGMMLIEALVAILIFSMGIIAMMGLQAASIKLSTDAKYRSDASLLANELIGQMWVNRNTAAGQATESAQLIANFASPGGAFYTPWLNDVNVALPNSSGANQPVVTIATQNPTAPATSTSSLVTITIFWKSPEEPASTGTLCGVTIPTAAHCYIVMAQII